MHELISKERIKDLAVKLSTSAAKPEFLQELMGVRRSSVEQKYEAARRVATLENIKSKNIPVDPEFRISTRSFEDPKVFQALKRKENSDTPIIYYEDNHGYFEYQGTIITIIDGYAEDENREINPTLEIQLLIQKGIEDIGEFISTPEFDILVNELYATSRNERAAFVIDEILDIEKMKDRNIKVPADMKIQRSHFDDERPTLFCVTKYIDGAYPWHKVTITFDNDFAL